MASLQPTQTTAYQSRLGSRLRVLVTQPLPAAAVAAVAPPCLPTRCRRIRRSRSRSILLLASAASVPAPDGNTAGSSSGGSSSTSSSSSTSMPASGLQADDSGEPGEQPAAAAVEQQRQQAGAGGVLGWLLRQQQRSAELRKRLASLGLAAVLSYGLFDGISYTIAFSLAFLGYEAQTGLNPTQNVADIVKICILMWAGNNVTRPFRLAGAAALAPFMDKVMDRLQQRLGLRRKAAAFGILVALVAGVCFSILGGLFFSRWARG